jgi:uncharacterized protein YdcH (DUF465 family)
MSKKSDRRSGVSFSPELKEVMSRLKRKEPELQELIDQEERSDHGREQLERNGGTDKTAPV